VSCGMLLCVDLGANAPCLIEFVNQFRKRGMLSSRSIMVETAEASQPAS